MAARGIDSGTDLGLVGLAVIWGANYSVVKAALGHLDPMAFNALRFPLATLVVWGIARRIPAPVVLPRDRVRLVVLAILGNVVYQLSFILGMDRTLAGNASLLLSTSPVWTMLFASALGDERPTRAVVAGAAATIGGMALVVLGQGAALGLGSATLAGDALIVLAAVFWAAYTAAAAPLVRAYGSLRVTAWSLQIGTPVLVVLGLPGLVDLDWGAVPLGAWAGTAYAGVLAIGIAYALWNRGIQRLGQARTAVYQNLVPVAALAVAWVALGEVPTALQASGAAVILAGVSLARLGRRSAQMPGPSSLR
jgi:drug/metabolite transporter (DMT)-like permease